MERVDEEEEEEGEIKRDVSGIPQVRGPVERETMIAVFLM